jgi:Na+/proline symporter
MDPLVLFIIVVAYFSLLIVISVITGKHSANADFYVGNRRSPWFLVAFGMIGASISGVTYISIPGEVGPTAFSYLQLVFGYFAGYMVIAKILLPLYYKMNLSSIYVYLNERFGKFSYKTGSFFFQLSRVIGSSFRLYLAVLVLDGYVLSHFGIPFWASILITLALIYTYSFRGGIRTIVYTDTLQTFFLVLGVTLSIVLISKEMNLNLGGLFERIRVSDYSKVFVWDWKPGNNFFKHFLSGMFICIAMTGLDQDMMQKNLSCKNIKDAQKNMYWMSTMLIFVNILFLSLGALLYIYAGSKGAIIESYGNADCQVSFLNTASNSFYCSNTDDLFPYLVFNFLPPAVGIVFLIGLIAAAYASSDSALTALTTSFCIDFLGIDENNKNTLIRKFVHVGYSLLFFVLIILYKSFNNQSVINSIFTIAGYTYGPLLGIFAFGIFTKYKVRDSLVPYISVISPVLCYFLDRNSESWFWGYKFGFELLLVNGLIVFLGLLVTKKR